MMAEPRPHRSLSLLFLFKTNGMLSAFQARPSATVAPSRRVFFHGRPVAWRRLSIMAARNVHDRASRATLLDRIAALLRQPLLAPMDAEEASKTTALLVPGDALE